MYLDYTPEQKELKSRLRSYFATLMTPELEAEIAELESSGPLCQTALEQIKRDDWLGIG